MRLPNEQIRYSSYIKPWDNNFLQKNCKNVVSSCSERELNRDICFRTYIIYTLKREGENQLKKKKNNNYVSQGTSSTKDIFGEMAGALAVNSRNFMYVLLIQGRK